MKEICNVNSYKDKLIKDCVKVYVEVILWACHTLGLRKLSKLTVKWYWQNTWLVLKPVLFILHNYLKEIMNSYDKKFWIIKIKYCWCVYCFSSIKYNLSEVILIKFHNYRTLHCFQMSWLGVSRIPDIMTCQG